MDEERIMTETSPTVSDVQIQRSIEENPLRDLIKNVIGMVSEVVKESEGDLPVTESRPEICKRCGSPLDSSAGELNIPYHDNLFKRYFLCRHCSQRAITL